ncbi:hypothetical protein [Actibacterium sp. 188UL27-1]|uniref:hypothetical protein n=1 Tax=Actibacterium sp. 188UL27-1 TaxID=2786961 RepID=UPI0019599322|nr:hypothetical protein [Actibacterium sp. 188UL27-1]MBM7066178.1 hypothetical protein [Actibacterium sp. 188UL27-1]
MLYLLTDAGTQIKNGQLVIKGRATVFALALLLGYTAQAGLAVDGPRQAGRIQVELASVGALLGDHDHDRGRDDDDRSGDDDDDEND